MPEIKLGPSESEDPLQQHNLRQMRSKERAYASELLYELLAPRVLQMMAANAAYSDRESLFLEEIYDGLRKSASEEITLEDIEQVLQMLEAAGSVIGKGDNDHPYTKLWTINVAKHPRPT